MDRLPEYKQLTDSEISALQQQSDEVYRDKLTKGGRFTEKGAVDAYTNGLHEQINPYLYGKLNFPPEIQKRYDEDARLIDAAMEKFTLDCDLLAYSGTKAKHFVDWNVGDISEIPAYLSASLNEKYAKTFFNTANKDKTTAPLMIELRAPKGAKSIYIGANTKYTKGGDVYNELELLLGRGTYYKVIAREKFKIVLEVLL